MQSIPLFRQLRYNIRDELIAADEVSYAHDDIGLYAPTSMSEVGNQTLIKTETGIWSVTYNAENRPIRWQSGDTVITMAFDRMGRRVEMRTMKDGAETLQRFVYDNYLCIQQLRGADNALFHSYIWDPTEPIATQPLIFLPASGVLSYYFHDGNKNVSDLVCLSGAFVHYDYTSFGTCNTNDTLRNPIRFSSEMYDASLGLVYYNYRHYSDVNGQWGARDPLGEEVSVNLYSTTNRFGVDFLGLVIIYIGGANEKRSGQLKGFADMVGAGTDDTFDWSQRGSVEARIKEILSQNKNEPIVLVGHSWGGDTAAQVARNMSSEICNLTLITLDPVSGIKPINLGDITKPERNNIWINVHPPVNWMDYVNSIPGVGAWGIGGLVSAGTGGVMNLFGGKGNDAIAIGGGRWNEEKGAQNINMGQLDHHDVKRMLELTHPGIGKTIKEIIKIRNTKHK